MFIDVNPHRLSYFETWGKQSPLCNRFGKDKVFQHFLCHKAFFAELVASSLSGKASLARDALVPLSVWTVSSVYHMLAVSSVWPQARV